METKKENLSIRIPEELNIKFTEHVSKLGMSKNAFIINLLHKVLKPQKGRQKKEISTSQRERKEKNK